MKIYQCQKCKKVIFTNEELNCENWVELIPGTVDASKEKHVPVVTKKCKQVKVDVGSVAHPMTQEHLIEWVLIETERIAIYTDFGERKKWIEKLFTKLVTVCSS